MAKLFVKNQTFPISPNPPAGYFYMGIDAADNAWKKQDSTGTVYTLEGALNLNSLPEKSFPAESDYLVIYDVAGAAHKKILKKKIHSMNPELVNRVASDFIESVSGPFSIDNQGAGASAQLGTYGVDGVEKAKGVLQFDTGGSAAGRCSITGSSSTGLFKLAGDTFRVLGRLAIEALSDAAQSFEVYFGITDHFYSAGSGTNGVYLYYNHAVNGGRWYFQSKVAGVIMASVDTGIALDLTYRNLEVIYDDTSARAYIDGALVGTISSANLPSGVSQPFGLGAEIQKLVGSNSRAADLDWLSFETYSTAAR